MLLLCCTLRSLACACAFDHALKPSSAPPCTSCVLHALPDLRADNLPYTAALCRYLRRWCDEWEADLEARPEEVKQSREGEWVGLWICGFMAL